MISIASVVWGLWILLNIIAVATPMLFYVGVQSSEHESKAHRRMYFILLVTVFLPALLVAVLISVGVSIIFRMKGQ